MSAVATQLRAAGPPPLPPHDLFDRLRLFTRAEYHKMLDAGILYSGEPVELLEGLVMRKMSRNTPHEASLRRLNARLPKYLPVGWFLQLQGAVGLAGSEPEPDGAVLRGDETSYDTHHPEPSDIGFVIEVADTSLTSDRRDKGRMYARDGISVYWIVNVSDGWVEVYTEPDPTTDPPVYRTRTDFPIGQVVPLVLDGVTVAVLPVADLFPA